MPCWYSTRATHWFHAADSSRCASLARAFPSLSRMAAAVATASAQLRKAPAMQACTHRVTARRVACCSWAFSRHWFHAAARSRLAILARAPSSFSRMPCWYSTRATHWFHAAAMSRCVIFFNALCSFSAMSLRYNSSPTQAFHAA